MIGEGIRNVEDQRACWIEETEDMLDLFRPEIVQQIRSSQNVLGRVEVHFRGQSRHIIQCLGRWEIRECVESQALELLKNPFLRLRADQKGKILIEQSEDGIDVVVTEVGEGD